MDGAVSYSALLDAYIDCRRHKRSTPAARAFERDLEQHLAELHAALNAGTYAPGASICFAIRRPKRREVWAAGFCDRVVHHLIYRHVGGRFERAFIADSCACVPGRGTLYGAQRLERKVRSITRNWTRPAYYLKCDIRSFFPSLDKRILLELLLARIPEPFWRWLVELVLFHDPRENVEIRGDATQLSLIPPGKSLFGRPSHLGLPIGNLPSQFGANVHLNELDQFAKHRLRVRHYIRYVDDFILLHESPRQLNAWRAAIETFLEERLALQLNPAKTVLQPVDRGIDFVGQVIKPHRRVIRRRTRDAALSRIAHLPHEQVAAAATSYLGLMRQASQGHRDQALIANAARSRGFAVNHQLTRVYP